MFDQLDNHFLVMFDGREEFTFHDDTYKVSNCDITAVIGFVGFTVGSEEKRDGGLSLVECRGR